MHIFESGKCLFLYLIKFEILQTVEANVRNHVYHANIDNGGGFNMVSVATVPGTNYIDWNKMIEDYKNQQQSDVFAEDGILLDRGTLIPVKANHSVAETMKELSTINEENIMSSLNVLLC